MKAVFVPFEENLIEEVSKELVADMKGDDLSHTAVVFPGKRPYYYLISSLSNRCKKTIFPPLITSMDEFISKILLWSGFEFSPLNALDGVYILFKILKDKNLHLELPVPYREYFNRFEDFLFWGFEILRAMEEMDEALVEEKKVEEMKKALSAGSNFSSPIPVEKIAEVALNLFQPFQDEMEKRALWTRGYRYRRASSLPVSEILRGKRIEKIIFAGFFLLTRSEREVIKRTGEGLDVKLFFHVSERKKWKEFDEILNVLGINDVVEIRSQKEIPLEDKLSFHPSSNLHFELLRLSCLLKDEKNWDDLAIVLPKSESLIPLLSDVVSRFDVEFNLSMGYPLLRSPLFSLMESILTLQETKDNDLYYIHSYLSIIKHPYIRNIRRENGEVIGSLLRKIEKEITEKKLIFFSLKDIEKIVDADERKDLVNFHDIFVKNFDKVKKLESLSTAFEKVIEFLVRKSDFPSHPLSSEILEGITNFLKEIKKSLIKDEEFEIEALKRLFRGSATNYRIPLPGVPLKGVQIIGMLETRCLNFKKVIILDMNEGVIPGVRKHEPVFSTWIKKNLGLPIYRDNEQIYRYHFFRLIGSAEKVMLFYIKDADTPRSRFIEELIWEIEKKKGSLVKEDGMKIPVQIFLPKKVEGVKKDENTMELIGKMKFTPTGIDAYLECPLKFYFKEVLKLSPVQSIEEEVEPLDVGIIAHSALKKTFEPFLNKNLSEMDFDKMIESVGKIVEEIMKSTLSIITPEREIFQRILTEVLKKYLLKEKDIIFSKDKECKMRILELENEGAMVTRIDGKDVEITGRWDRVDEVENRIRVVDYKTGRSEKHKLKKSGVSFVKFSREEVIENGINSLQLPCYVLIYKDKNKPSLPVDATVILLRDVFKESDWRVEWGEKIPEEIFKNIIIGIIKEIIDPEVPFYPDEKGDCSKCAYRTPCLSMRAR
jgi:CRISPR/Cas system-associated exonuclease Cas4 (RecB family)